MNITVKRPLKTVDIITDMESMSQILQVANDLQTLKDEPTGGLTEGEMSQRRKQGKNLQEELKKLIDAQEASTLVLTLRAVNASQWTQIVVKNTKNEKGMTTKDFPGMVKTALSLMLEKTAWKNGEDVTLDDIPGFVDSLLDTQIMDIMGVIQTLNSPEIALPKAILNLL